MKCDTVLLQTCLYSEYLSPVALNSRATNDK